MYDYHAGAVIYMDSVHPLSAIVLCYHANPVTWPVMLIY